MRTRRQMTARAVLIHGIIVNSGLKGATAKALIRIGIGCVSKAWSGIHLVASEIFCGAVA